MLTGSIFDIMKYSIRDGPGIRTTIFFKGCPLKCLWCHNPESQDPEPQLMFWPDRCIGCGDCVETCVNQAILPGGIHKERCRRCGQCAAVCPTLAREMVGRRVAVEEVVREIERDRIFYEESGGGVTFSGGEPLVQPSFLHSLLDACQDREIATAVDTTGYTAEETLLSISEKVDLFLYDIKLMDDEKHKLFTGVSNRLILNNLQKLSQRHPHIIIRIPIIPGINDDRENLEQMASFISTLQNIWEVQLLPYHNTGMGKYERLNLPYQLAQTQPPADEAMQLLAGEFRSYGLNVKIGG
ncbi:glycyl-radical enzyme activating protein family [Desulforamulus reducens MI-1]|uniref:Glycyl-radical enzyme activating protein family n=1 Tax=Desulforamulus reducens (strain ATCC BAA-1160 / DSM 100696 / MI-1) TaxID=349161 RepID=A4J8R6_DESRM|nr:glycyl-radical enzyme activating protein [Desulforamulus reducens]ABO51469.1 glycyl-radical enzyme activating protein family [Desulforamulus reducens MI-1]